MPAAHVNLNEVPTEVERPIPQTMRGLLDWDFDWTYSPAMSDGMSEEPATVRALLNTEYGEVYVRWEDIEDHWYVATVQCPGWSDRRPEGPRSVRGVQRWLEQMDIPRSEKLWWLS